MSRRKWIFLGFFSTFAYYYKSHMKILFFPLFIILSFVITDVRAADEDELPDSLLTEDYLYEYTFTDFSKAQRIIEQMRAQKKLSQYRLDIAEGDLYFNTGRYHQGLRYYKRAFESETVQKNDTEYMDVVHRMISSYDCLHEEEKQACYTELLLEKARACGDKAMEAVALFNMGKMLYYQEDKERGYGLIHEGIALMENGDYKYKYDNLRYNYHTLLILLQRDGRFEEALKVLDDLERVIGCSSEGLPLIDGLAQKERKTLLAQRAVLFNYLKQYDRAERAYQEWTEIGGAYTKDDYLIIPYLMGQQRYKEAIQLCNPRERFLVDHRDTINYHMMTLKRTLGEIYDASGDHKQAAIYFKALAVLTDSLKRREQQSAAMDLAIANDVYEKERQLEAQDTQIRIHNILLVSALIIVLLLVVMLWRNMYYMRTIRHKNKVMVNTVAGMLAYKERLIRTDNQRDYPPPPPASCLGERILELETKADISPQDSAGENDSGKRTVELFELLERKISEQQLFLNPNLSRGDLMRLINVSKNQIAQIIQAGTGTNLAGYLNGLRMEYAARLLIRYPEYTINAIAHEAGIPNVSSFHRLFRTQFGMTPSEFRKARCD